MSRRENTRDPVRPADESDTGEYVLDDERSIGKSRYGQVRQEERRCILL